MTGFSGTFRSFHGAVAVPVLDKGDGTISNVTHDWAASTAGLGGGLAVTVLRLTIRNYRVDVAKERLAELAISNHCDWVFFLDDDVLVPPDALLKMTKLWKSDPKYKVISGVYWSKSDPPVPLVFRDTLKGSYYDWTTQDLITADGAGAGALFVDTEVFKKLPKPWFSNQYFFEDPRITYDIQKWQITDQLGTELSKGKDADPVIVKGLEDQMKNLMESVQKAQQGNLDPNLLKNMHADASTTEDLYFFKNVKEHLGLDLWIDCSIQCMHQDKRTGRVFGISPDMPQSKPRHEGRYQSGDKVVLDIGAGTAPYFIEEGKPVRVDLDESTKPDIVADARQLPIEDCYADVVLASHILEHFSFRETISVLKEWARVLKRGGKLAIVVPNLRWASKLILNPSPDVETMERAMFMYYSGQQGDLKKAYTDFHMAGFTPESIGGLLERVGGFEDIHVFTSDGNYGNWNEPSTLHTEDIDGYNILVFAYKKKHQAAITLKLPMKDQEEAMYHIGDESTVHADDMKKKWWGTSIVHPKKEPVKEEVKEPEPEKKEIKPKRKGAKKDAHKV